MIFDSPFTQNVTSVPFPLSCWIIPEKLLAGGVILDLRMRKVLNMDIKSTNLQFLADLDKDLLTRLPWQSPEEKSVH